MKNKIKIIRVYHLQLWQMACIKPNTTTTSPSTTRLISRSTPLVLKPNRVNYALTPLSALTIRVIIKPTPTLAHSGTIVSTKNGTLRNTRKSEIPGLNQFTQSWAVMTNDYQEYQDFLAEHAKKQSHCQHNPRNPIQVWCSIYSRTILVNYSLYS